MYIYLSLLSISNLEQEKLESLAVEDFFFVLCSLPLGQLVYSVPQSQKCSSSYLAPNTPFCCSCCFHHSLIPTPHPHAHTPHYFALYILAIAISAGTKIWRSYMSHKRSTRGTTNGQHTSGQRTGNGVCLLFHQAEANWIMGLCSRFHWKGKWIWGPSNYHVYPLWFSSSFI